MSPGEALIARKVCPLCVVDDAAVALAVALQVHFAKYNGRQGVECELIVVGATDPVNRFVLEKAAITKEQGRGFEHIGEKLLVLFIRDDFLEDVIPRQEIRYRLAASWECSERFDVLMKFREHFVLVLQHGIERVVHLFTLLGCE